jgi:predicted nucleotidyltransferase
MKTSLDIRPEHLKIVQNILKKHLPTNATIWVFGSRAKGTAKKFSDLDLAIDAGKPLASSIMIELAFDFEESDLPYKVDIIDLVTIKENFKKIIMQDRILIVL